MLIRINQQGREERNVGGCQTKYMTNMLAKHIDKHMITGGGDTARQSLAAWIHLDPCSYSLLPHHNSFSLRLWIIAR